MQSGYLDSCESLRTVWLWDEDYVDPELVESLSGALPDAQIFQGFDQAECAFFVTLLPLTGGDDDSHALHGQPLPNIRVWLHCCAALCAPVGKGETSCTQGPTYDVTLFQICLFCLWKVWCLIGKSRAMAKATATVTS